MTFLPEALLVALRAIARHKLRSGLTSLGILVGVASLVVVATLSTGVGAAMDGVLDGLGSNSLFVTPNEPTSFGPGSGTERLTEADGEALARDASELVAVAPVLSTQARVVHGDRNVATTVLGTTLSYLTIRRIAVASGAAWDDRSEATKEAVCLLGQSVRQELFGDGDPVGATLRVGRSTCRVLGVLRSRGAPMLGMDRDDCVLMPIGSFRARVLATSPGRVDQLVVSTASESDVERASHDIAAILGQRHHFVAGDTRDFQVRSQSELRDAERAITGGLSVLLLTIAAISVVVGGVGVANTMLVSVAERTREIAVRMALGATPNDVFRQFLVESISLCAIGSALGTGLGLAAGALIGHVLGWTARPDVTVVVLASAVAVVVGLLAGVIPARRAANLPPMQALRGE